MQTRKAESAQKKFKQVPGTFAKLGEKEQRQQLWFVMVQVATLRFSSDRTSS